MDMPDKVHGLGSSPRFDRASVPAALLSRHALAERNWARLRVLTGTVTFVDLREGRKVTIHAGASAVVPPVLPHCVELGDDACFQLEFFREDD